MKRIMLALVVAATAPAWPAMTSAPITIAVAQTPCTTGLTLTLHPGLPPSSRPAYPPVAWDIPKGPFRVAVPLYPGAKRLTTFVGYPVPEYPRSPYLQTGVAEYRAGGPGKPDVESWYDSAFKSCGWHSIGEMQSEGAIFSSGTTYASNRNPHLTVEMTFGGAPSSQNFVAYAAEEITYPPRPARSYLRGPFVRLRVAVSQVVSTSPTVTSTIERATITDRSAIRDLVSEVNGIKDYFTVPTVCLGALETTGPIWLSFVRPDGSTEHTFEGMWGPCGGLTVNGVRWLIDPSDVFNTAVRLVHQANAKPITLPFERTIKGPWISSWLRIPAGNYNLLLSAGRRCGPGFAFENHTGHSVFPAHGPGSFPIIIDRPERGPGGWGVWQLHLRTDIYRIDYRSADYGCHWVVSIER